MIVVKNLLAGIILASTSLGVFRVAGEIACTHLFQARAFSMLTRQLHTKEGMPIPQMACGKLLWVERGRGFFQVRSHFRGQTLKLNMRRNIVNERTFSR